MGETISQSLSLEVDANTTKAKLGLDNLKKGVDGVAGAASEADKALGGAKKGLDGAGGAASSTSKALGNTTAALGKTSSALKKVGGSSRATMFAIGNLGETFSIARNGGYQMRFLIHQLMDSMMLLGPKGLVIAAAVAGVGYLSRKLITVGDSATASSADILEFKKQAVKSMQDMKTQISRMEISLMFDDMAKGPRRVFEEAKMAAEMQISFSKSFVGRVKNEQIAIANQIAQLKGLQEGRSEQAEQMGARGLKLAERQLMFEEQVGEGQHDRMKMAQEIGPKIIILEKQLEKHTKDHAEAVKEQNREMFKNNAILDEMVRFQPELTAAQNRYADALKRTVKNKKDENEETAKGNALDDDGFLGAIADDDMGFQGFVAPTQKREEAKTAIVIKEVKKRTEAEIAAEKQSEALKTSAFNLGASLISESIKMSIEGEKNLGQALLKMFLERTGQTLVALGTRAVFEGGIMLAQGNPQGALQVGLGSAAIAAGVGMSAGAAQVASGVGAAGGAGGAGISSGTSSGTTGGVSSGGFGGSTAQQGTGSTIINISYGVGGPEPESAAQAVLDAIAFGGRRGMRGRA